MRADRSAGPAPRRPGPWGAAWAPARLLEREGLGVRPGAPAAVGTRPFRTRDATSCLCSGWRTGLPVRVGRGGGPSGLERLRVRPGEAREPALPGARGLRSRGSRGCCRPAPRGASSRAARSWERGCHRLALPRLAERLWDAGSGPPRRCRGDCALRSPVPAPCQALISAHPAVMGKPRPAPTPVPQFRTRRGKAAGEEPGEGVQGAREGPAPHRGPLPGPLGLHGAPSQDTISYVCVPGPFPSVGEPGLETKHLRGLVL